MTVVCGKPELATDERDVLVNPKLVIEILSESTERKDRGFKFRQYQRIASLEEYVLVSQWRQSVECYSRRADGSWGEYALFDGPGAALKLRSLDLEIPLAEIYQGVELDPLAI